MSRVVAVAILVALAAGSALAQAPRGDDELGRIMARAQAAWSQGRLPDALSESRNAAKLAPGTLAPVLAHARMAELMGEFDEATDAYAHAEKLAPDDQGQLASRVAFAYRIGDEQGALTRLDKMVDLYPWRTRFLYTYGPARIQPWLLKENPGLAGIIELRVDMLMEWGDLERARLVAQTYGIVENGKHYCADASARMRRETGTGPEALRDLRLAALGEPGNASCIWWLGQTTTDEGYVRLGRVLVTESIRLVRLQRHEAFQRMHEGYMRVRLGNGQEVPKRAEQLFIIGRQRYLRDRDADGAARLFTESVRLAPRFARPYSYLSRIAWDRGDKDGAVVWLQRGVEADPDSWRTHRNLGKLLAAVGRTELAEVHLRKAVELFEDDAGGRFALARVLYARGSFAEYVAQTHIAGPGRTLPPAPDPPLVRGWVYD